MKNSGLWSLLVVAAVAGGCSSGTEPQAAALSFRQQPGNATINQPITPPVRVGFVDAQASQVTGTDAQVTIALIPTSGSPNTTLSGTLTVQSVNGVATFSDLSLDGTGAGFQLVATADGFPPRNSNPFNVQ